MNPLSRLLAAIVGAVALVAAFFFGFVILLVVVAVGLVAGLVIWFRIWWIKRKLTASGGSHVPGFGEPPTRQPDAARPSEDVIEAEYEVVSRSDEQ